MLSRKIMSGLTFLFFLFSGVTWVAGEAGQGAEGRLTIADLFGVVLIIAAFLQRILLRKSSVSLPRDYLAFFPFFGVLIVGVSFSDYPERGAMELAVVFFIFSVSLALVNIYRCGNWDGVFADLMYFLLVAGSLLAFIGVLQFFIFPSMFSGSHGGLSGTFRNTGQAGAFFGVYLAILIPAFLAGFIKPRVANFCMLFLIILALIFTFKRAALIGLLVGLFFLVFRLYASSSLRDKKIAIYSMILCAIAAPVVVSFYTWGLDNVSGMDWRVASKFSATTVEDFSEGFLADNVSAATQAFLDRPFIGVGLGNVAGVYTEKYEIHSTYLAVFSSAGFLGSCFYIFFMGVLISRVWRFSGPGPYGAFLKYFFPFLIGLIVSWSYTYHLRKREFWILFFVVSFCIYLSNDFRRRYRHSEVS